MLGKECLEGMRAVFRMAPDSGGHVFIYPASGTGAWEAAIVNTLSPGDRVLMFETGHFAMLWRKIAESFGLQVDFVPGDWRHGVDPAAVETKLREDTGRGQGRDVRPQRDLHRCRQPHRRGAEGDGRHGASGPADGGHDFLAGLD